MAERIPQVTDRQSTSRISVRDIAAASAGNVFEYFDLTLYTFFSVIIGKMMFPSQDPAAQVLLSLGVFGVGYCARPIGAMFFGGFADRRGRKAAVNISLLMMACGTGMIGLAPTYAQAGLLAPAIILLGRVIQGFSSGGETGAVTTFLVETAPANRKAFYASWTVATQGVATTFGASAAWIMSSTLSPEALQLWGWRVPFVLGVAIVPIARYLRRALHETLDEATAAKASRQGPVKMLFSNHLSTALLALLATVGGNAAYVIINLYMPTYAIHELGLPTNISVAVAIAAGLVTFVVSPLGGLLADIYGRKKPQIISRVLLIALAYPAFMLITTYPHPMVLLVCVGGLSGLLGLSSGIYAQMAESFPKSVRASGFATAYAAATAISGGFAQLFITGLIQITGSKMVPAFYLMAVGAVSLIGVALLRPDPPDVGSAGGEGQGSPAPGLGRQPSRVRQKAATV